jgi:hypothetical protein
MRLWLVQHQASVLLIPLVSWLSPANHGEGAFLAPSMKYLWQYWAWVPRFVVGDFGYVGAPAKAYCRVRWDSVVLTHRRGDQLLVPPFETETRVCCPQGQPLRWLGYEQEAQAHWFGVRQPATLCSWCWQASSCPREFVYPATTQETLLGRLPLSTRGAQLLLRRVRPWVEAAQSFEKNQLGLSEMFFNSLRLTWCMALLADSVCLLRAQALLKSYGSTKALLSKLAPRQMTLDLL